MGLDIRELALDTLSVSPQNVRKDTGDLTELIASITEVGVLEPIIVRPMGEEYEVIAGYRRTEAAREAGLTTIPASVVEMTEVQAILASLIENIQRKDLTLEERVLSYQQLQALEPEYHSQRALAKAIGRRNHRKIGEDFQAYEMALRLQPYGIRVGSHFPRKSPERQRGDVLPEYHAVLLHSASSSRRAKAAVPDEVFDADMAKLAREIAPHSQHEAKEILALMQSAVDYMDNLSGEQAAGAILPAQHEASHWHGVVTCAYCNQELTLVHIADNTHAVTPQPSQLADQEAEADEPYKNP